MYSQQPNHYPVMDSVNYSNNSTIPYLPLQSNANNTSTTAGVYSANTTTATTNQSSIVRQTQLPPPPPPHNQQHHHQQQQQGYTVVPPEPVPSATDAQPTPPLSISQLADFASTMVFLMWHARRASVMALHDVSKIQQTHTDDQDPGHSRETANIANCKSSAFKKFCEQILSATQLSESVILLSLKYIAMLLQNNPNIQGADGSEYRLFTVALMLANKFLDDNTFTNKTWSDVSGMKVTDLNIMELEFLDVLRFRLFIRNDEYERWKSAILLFRSQLANANEAQKQEQQQQLFEETFKNIVSPTVQHQQQQYHQQYLLMLSKAQQPQYPTQPLNRPLTRVPLRIPHQPVWRTSQTIPGSSVQAPIYDTNLIQQHQVQQVQQPQQQQVHQTYSQPQQQQQQQVQQQVQQQQPSTRPYIAPASSNVVQHSNMTVMVPTPVSNNSSADYYHTKQPVYDSYATSQPNSILSSDPSTSLYHQRMDYSSTTNHPTTTAHVYPQRQQQQQQQQQQHVYSQQPSVISNASSRLSGINLTSQAQDFGATNVVSTAPNNNNSYYYMTPPSTAKPATTPPALDGSYYRNQSYINPTMQPAAAPSRPNNNSNYYGNEMVHTTKPVVSADYSAYDMSASQPNDLYSQAPVQQSAGYQQHAYNNSRPTSQQIYTNPPPKQYSGPTLEDPLTAAASYRRK